MSLIHGHHGPEARHALEREAQLPTTALEREQRRGLELGLPGADSIVDKTIPTFSRGELPHFAGINTFLKAPYVEDVRRCGEYDIAVSAPPMTGARPTGPGLASALKACVVSRPFTGLTRSSWGWTCANR